MSGDTDESFGGQPNDSPQSLRQHLTTSKTDPDSGVNSPLNTTQRYANVPEALRLTDQWVSWRREQRDGKPTKVPYDVYGNKAKPNDPSTWSSFAAVTQSTQDNRADGVGFMFGEGDGFAGVDLDHCVEPESGEVAPWALEIADRLETYTEISPSGTGLHLLMRGEIPHNRKLSKPHGIEVYDSVRFLTITGECIRNPHTLSEPGRVLADWYEATFPVPERTAGEGTDLRSPELTDEQVLEKAFGARNGDKAQRLWRGDTSEQGDDLNRSDAALLSLLAFYTQDEVQLDRLFRQSKLNREKWTKRADYRERTIRLALSGQSSVYNPEGGTPTRAEGRGTAFKLIDFSEVRTLPRPKWLVEGLLAQNSIATLYGPSGIGKTFLTVDLAMRLALGWDWHGRKTVSGPVVYIACEDGEGVGFRIAGWSDYHKVTDSQLQGTGKLLADSVSFRDMGQVGALIDTLEQLPEPPRLVVVDTLAWAMVGGDEDSTKDVMQVLEGARRLHSRFGCTVLIVHHTRKADDVERGNGHLRNGSYTMLKLTGEGGELQLEVDKQKGGAKGEPMGFRLVPVATNEDKSLLVMDTTCIIERVTGSTTATHDKLTEREHKLLGIIRETYGTTEGFSYTRLKAVVGKDMSDKTFERALNDLKRRGLITQSADRKPYFLAPEGAYEGVTLPAPSPGVNAQPLRQAPSPAPEGTDGGLEPVTTGSKNHPPSHRHPTVIPRPDGDSPSPPPPSHPIGVTVGGGGVGGNAKTPPFGGKRGSADYIGKQSPRHVFPKHTSQ